MYLKIISECMFIKLIFYYFKIFGLAPVSLKIKKTNVNSLDFSVRLTLKNSLFNAFLIFITIIIELSSMYILQNTYDLLSYESEKIFDLITVGLSMFETVSILLFFTYHRKKICELILKIIEMRKFLTNGKNIHKHFKNYSSSDAVKIFIMNTFFLILLIITSPKKYIFPYMASHLCVCVNYSVIIQYVFVLKLLKEFFETANSYLASIGKLSIENNECNRSSSNISSNIIQEISSVYKFYAELKKLSEKFSSFYAKPVFFSISQSFRNMIMICYHIFKPVVIGKNMLSFELWINCVILGIITCFLLAILTQSVGDVIVEVLVITFITSIKNKIYIFSVNVNIVFLNFMNLL